MPTYKIIFFPLKVITYSKKKIIYVFIAQEVQKNIFLMDFQPKFLKS